MDGVFVCKSCKRQYKTLSLNAKCEHCDSLLEFKIIFDNEEIIPFTGPLTFWRYNCLFPSIEEKNRLNWSEGGTPFIKSKNLSALLGLSNLFLKDETKNPTNSYSDRATSLILSYALEMNYQSVVCASNGNSGASVAAYTARSPLACKIIVPKKVAIGKLAQMYIFSDNISEFGELLDNSIVHAEGLSKKDGLFQATPEINPLSIEAQATIAYEIIEQTQSTEQPDWIIVPMGAGGLIYSIWKGFKTFYGLKLCNKLPRLVGIQAIGCAPIVEAFENNRVIEPLINPNTKALEILVGNPYWGDAALSAIKESKGFAISVNDIEIIESEKDLARSEGIFAESASSATLAGLKKLMNDGIDKADNIVCLITGSGIKEPYILKALSDRPKIMGQKVSTKLEILRILEIDASYGYAIWQALGTKRSIQSIYQHLGELEDKGLIMSEQIKNKKYFKINKKGKEVLTALETLVDLF
ncbi:MAG TPA: threonine synthase [Candidatus Deferrimicrobium sp.]|nr:threonine synthase [Candidatus Deferrimicrobium sp.]